MSNYSLTVLFLGFPRRSPRLHFVAAMTTVLQVVAVAPAVSCGAVHASRGVQNGAVSAPMLARKSGAKASFVARPSKFLDGQKSVKAPRKLICQAQETATGAGPVTDATFKELVLDSDVPVLVDFWAPWCGPCRMIAPLIDELSKQYAGKLKCVKLNTDESPGVATEYGIRSIPTVMIFKYGKKVDTVIGAVPKTTLTTTIDKYLD